MTTAMQLANLEAILAEGRLKLARLRREQEEEARTQAGKAADRTEAHWKALVVTVVADVPGCLLRDTNIIAKPADWRCDDSAVTAVFELIIRPPGFGPVLAAYSYNYGQGEWRSDQHRWYRCKWAVPVHVLVCGRDGDHHVVRGDEQGWTCTNDLALALAAAEVEGVNLAAREAEAAELNRQRREQEALAASRKTLDRHPAEHLRDLILDIAREAVAERHRE